LSTTTASWSRTDSRHSSTCPAALNVTTTTATSSAIRDRHRAPAQTLPEDHDQAGGGEQQRHQGEHEPDGERVVGVDADAGEEADEERLAHAEAVDRERHQPDEEEQWTAHDVRPQRRVDGDR